MTDEGTDAEGDALAERLRAIEDLPLDERAHAYAALHDELQRALDTVPGAAPRPGVA